MFFLSLQESGFSGLLDTYSGAEVAYSVRRLSSSYTGSLMRVRRSSDSAETDIGYDANGDLDTAAIASHCGVGSGYVVTWYDQSGNGNNLSRAVAGDQPRIYNAGSQEVDPNNGNNAIFFDGANHYFDLGSSIAVVQECYQHFVYNRASTGIMSTGLAGTASTPFGFLWFSNNGHYSGWDTTTLHDATQTSTGDFITTSLRDASSNVKLWTNGSAGTTQTDSGTAKTLVTAFNRNGNHHNGYAQELILWNSDQESNQSGIEGDANTYFSVF